MENSNYYGILPAPVRYDKELSAEAKLLFVEITALAQKDGYCYAKNQYFEELFNASQKTIDRRLRELINGGYITREIITQGNEIKERRLYLSSEMTIGIVKNDYRGIVKNDEVNNISIELNNINKKENIKRKKFEKPSIEEIKRYCSERNNLVDAEKFYDFYESKGWVVGKSPMKDWKAAVRTWESNSKPKRVYTLDEMDVSEKAANVDFDAIRKGWKKQ